MEEHLPECMDFLRKSCEYELPDEVQLYFGCWGQGRIKVRVIQILCCFLGLLNLDILIPSDAGDGEEQDRRVWGLVVIQSLHSGSCRET